MDVDSELWTSILQGMLLKGGRNESVNHGDVLDDLRSWKFHKGKYVSIVSAYFEYRAGAEHSQVQ